MKLANSRGIEPQSFDQSGTGAPPANPPGPAVRATAPPLSAPPAKGAMPLNSARSGSHRFAGFISGLKNQPMAWSPSGQPTGAPFTSRSAQSLRRSRLVDLMHEERASEMTTVFREKEGYPAPAQFSSAAISVPPPAVHGGAGTPAASETPMSGAASKPEAPVADGGGDSIRWAADSRPTNLLWQKIDDRQKNAIFDALNDREDLAGLILFRGAEAGRIEAMDGLDNHLLMHYHKDEFGDANLLRFAPKEGRVVAFETTAADTRAYVARVRPLVDAQRGQGTNAPAPPRYSAPGWLKSLFKRGDR